MATRSTIAIERADGTISQVYCHWDGYLAHNGEILLKHWSNPEKLEELIALGDLSVLGDEIGEKHDFDESSNLKCCTFYGRDRGETDIPVRNFTDFEDYDNNADQEEFNYILRSDGFWEVRELYKGGEYFSLNESIVASMETEND
jgi:hypothetical protein